MPSDKKRLQLFVRIICQIHAITAYTIVYLVVVWVCHVQIQTMYIHSGTWIENKHKYTDSRVSWADNAADMCDCKTYISVRCIFVVGV